MPTMLMFWQAAFFGRGLPVEAELKLVGLLTVAVLPCALALGGLARAQHLARGTTLRAPIVWAIASLIVLLSVEAALFRKVLPAGVQAKFDFLASVSTLCPLVALLGAKRPQDRAWQLIVLVFWPIAALPAIQGLIIQPPSALDVHAIWQVFLLVLILLGVANYLPTRFAGPCILAACGQCALLGEYLPGSSCWFHPLQSRLAKFLPELSTDGKLAGQRMWLILAGVGSLAVAICWACFIGRRPPKERPLHYPAWNTLWRAFRNNYGLVWSLRIIERINVLSFGSAPKVRLNWEGFHSNENSKNMESATEPPIELHSARWDDNIGDLESDFRALLCRFVSNRWIDEKMKAAED